MNIENKANDTLIFNHNKNNHLLNKDMMQIFFTRIANSSFTYNLGIRNSIHLWVMSLKQTSFSPN